MIFELAKLKRNDASISLFLKNGRTVEKLPNDPKTEQVSKRKRFSFTNKVTNIEEFVSDED